MRLCRDCGSPSVLHNRNLCQPCVHKRNIRNRANIAYVCKFCNRGKSEVAMRSDRAVCLPCHREQERARHNSKRYGYPPCAVCDARPSEKGKDGMCTECCALADMIDEACYA